MSTPILATKLYTPKPRPRAVARPQLIERLNEGMHRKLTLISAPAGFGKTTVVSAWVASGDRPVAWLSLDKGDSDLARFLTYMVGALQTIEPNFGESIAALLQSPQPPPHETILTALLNEIANIPRDFILVLDDYHAIDANAIDTAIAFLLEHLPPQAHFVIATREDPTLPLARLRARDQLTELRVADLRFSPSEAARFLNQSMSLSLSTEDISALETRTEGWIAGLQLAAILMQKQPDASDFIHSFTGSHHFVMDYLVEEVLRHQPESIQTFLLRTSILDRLCGPLCDAVLLDESARGQETLEYLERANLFLVPLDNERRWYRYHHLFADLLRQRLQYSLTAKETVSNLHMRASQWYETNGLALEAFQHAVAANDIERAERLIESKGIQLHFRVTVTTIINWLDSLPTQVLAARPSLWIRHASLLLVNGHTTGVEDKLNSAEAALQDADLDDKARYQIGQIATARATLALTRYQPETMIAQSLRALEYLHPKNLSLRANAYWTMGYAYFMQGRRAEARQALTESIALSQQSGNIFTTILAMVGLGNVQEADNELYQAAETYGQVIKIAGDQPLQIIYEAHLGLARVLYEWNDLDAAEQHGQQSLHLARQYDKVIDRFIVCEIFLARVKLARGDLSGAADVLEQSGQSARQKNFVFRLPDVAAAQVITFLRQGKLGEAAQLAQTYDLPLSRVRVLLDQKDPPAALALLGEYRQQMEDRGWHDERLKAAILQAIALQANGDQAIALQRLGEAMAFAEANNHIRIFLDEGAPMRQLLAEASVRNVMPSYAKKLLAEFAAAQQSGAVEPLLLHSQPLVEPLSQRELEVLQHIADGLSNREISEKLFLAIDTVKGHNRKIFEKLQVQRRTEAIARARALGLLQA